MRKRIFYAVTMLVLGGKLGAIAQPEETNLLPNGGFKQFKADDTLPANGWKFRYNKELKGKFMRDISFKGKEQALEVINPLTDKPVCLQQAIKLEKPGKYRASVWIKAGDDAQTIPKKKLAVVMRTIKTNWKKAFHDRPQMVQKGWLKYEYDFYVSEKDLGRYNFRIDVWGTGTFYIAEPSLRLIGTPVVVKKKNKEPLKETAYFSFDENLNENKSRTSPSISKKTELVSGFKGQGVTVADGGALSYPIAKFIKGESGSVALWIKTSEDPPPTFAPSDQVCLLIGGKNEINKTISKLLQLNISSPGITSNFSSAYGIAGSGYVRPRTVYYSKEWRHYIFTWDKDYGIQIYIDGRLFLVSKNSTIFEELSKIKPETLRLFTATGNNPAEKACFDELCLFNRGITEAEALTLYEQYVPVYPVLLDYATIAGSKKPFRVKMLHKKGSVPAELKVLAESLKGETLFEETLKVSKTDDYKINFHPEKIGNYRLSFLYGDKRIRTFEVTAVSAKSITSSMRASVSGEPKLKLREDIDCTKKYPASRYLDDGEVKVVDSPIGKYRTSMRSKFNFQTPNGFVYNFAIKNPGKPHWIEIEYPDDKPRFFYVVVEEKLDNMGWGKDKHTFSYSLATIGIANGLNNPITGNMAKKRLLFWPDSEQCLIGCFGYKTYPDTMGPAMKSIRIYENDGELPKLAVNTPAGMPQRAIGNWQEDGFMPTGCWFNRYKYNEGPSFDFWREKLKRRVEYVRFTGQNQIVIQVFRNGDMTGMQGVFPSDSSDKMPGWSTLAATIFDREKIPFYIQTCDYTGTSKMLHDKISKDNLEAVAKGVDAIEMFNADGMFPKSWSNLNFLCPAVREAYLKLIRFYRDQFGRYDTFKGILFFLGSSNFTFKNEKTGYGDFTIALFEKETGTKIPVANKSMVRFEKRYKYLKSNKKLWNKWIDWRCAKVKEFLLALTTELNAGEKKDLKIILPLKIHISRTAFFISDKLRNYPEKIDINAGFREMGIDIASLSSEPSLIIEPVSAPNFGLLYNKGEKRNIDALWYSNNFAQYLRENKSSAMMLSRHANMEIHSSKSSAIKKYWWPRGFWGNNGAFHCFSNALPDNKYLPQTLAWGLANADIRHIDHGWWGNPENGAYNNFQKFYQAYRSIPAVDFKKLPGVNDPVTIRQYNGKSGWIYLVNMQYYKSKVKITFSSDVKLTDTVFNRPQAVNGKVLEKELNPYQVVCFRSDKPLKIVNIEQIVSTNIVKELTQTVADLKTGAKLRPSSQATLIVKTAKKMLKEKRYSALYYLLRSYSAQQLLNEASKQLVFRASLNPDTKSLDIEASNRMGQSASVVLTLQGLPQGLSCPEKTQKFSLGGNDSKVLSFSIAGLDFKKNGCRNALEFELLTQTDGGKPGKGKYIFQPIVCTNASSVNVDGNISDWGGAAWYKLAKCDKKINPDHRKLIPLEDFNSEFATKWNQQGLYLATKVQEKALIAAKDDKSAWHYDFLEISIDQKNNALTGTIDDDCVFYIKNLANESQPQITMKPTDGKVVNLNYQCKVKRQRNGEETIYEIFIPATVLNQVRFKAGANIGFALKLHNREHTNDPAKDLWGYSVSTSEYPDVNSGVRNNILLSKKAE